MRLGLRYVRGLRKAAADRLLAERAARAFASLQDLVDRAALHRDELTALAEVGALNAFGLTRRSALWQVERAGRPRGPLLRDADARPRSLAAAGDDAARAAADRHRGHHVHHRPAPDDRPSRGAGRPRHQARVGPAAARRGHAAHRGGGGGLPPAAGHREGLPVPDPGGRDGARQHHRAPRPVRGARRGVVAHARPWRSTACCRPTAACPFAPSPCARCRCRAMHTASHDFH